MKVEYIVFILDKSGIRSPTLSSLQSCSSLFIAYYQTLCLLPKQLVHLVMKHLKAAQKQLEPPGTISGTKGVVK